MPAFGHILIVCTGNVCRSPMAQGLLAHALSAQPEPLRSLKVISAGVAAHTGETISENSVTALKKVGIDISGQRSKNVDEFTGEQFDFAVTVCDEAQEACPYFPGAKQQLHWGFPDPSAAVGSDEERLQVFRQVRDDIARSIREFIDTFGHERSD